MFLLPTMVASQVNEHMPGPWSPACSTPAFHYDKHMAARSRLFNLMSASFLPTRNDQVLAMPSRQLMSP